jgi:hypothetical protein
MAAAPPMLMISRFFVRALSTLEHGVRRVLGRRPQFQCVSRAQDFGFEKRDARAEFRDGLG